MLKEVALLRGSSRIKKEGVADSAIQSDEQQLELTNCLSRAKFKQGIPVNHQIFARRVEFCADV